MNLSRSLFVIAGILCSVSAFAYPTSSDSWKTILADSSVRVEQPAFAAVFGSNGWFNACVDGNNFRTIHPLPTCSKMGWTTGTEGDSVYQCVAWDAAKNATLPVQQVEQQCVKQGWTSGTEGDSVYQCVAYQGVDYDLPTTLTMKVYGHHWAYQNGTEGNGGPVQVEDYLFSKTFKIPACAH